MAERRGAKGRRMGSSRRRQLREGPGEAPAPAPSPTEDLPWVSEILQRVQEFCREQDEERAGFVTRSDMQKLQEKDLLCSREELELIFDGLDTAGTGRLSTAEFTAGLQQFLSSQKAARAHHQRKTASRRVCLVLPALEGVDSEERRHFATFMDQLGTDNISEEQEIWQLWVKLRQDEPQLLGNLEDFLAKMRHHIQEARSKKEALEVTLNKRVAEHEQEVQQLCEALEQQIQQERQRLEQESVARSHQHSVELQQALDASEREVQRLVTAQKELEKRCRRLRSTQQAASTENQQLEESNRVLEDHLQHLHQQLQQTHGRLRTVRAAVAWEHMEEPGDGVVAELPGETLMSPQMSPEKSEKHRSEMRVRLGSQSSKPKAKSTHQVVWEMLPAEISLLGPPARASLEEEEPFPAALKEEGSADQSSLLREMNDAIAALSKQLKPQAPGAPPAPADTAQHPRDDAEPHAGPEAAAAHGTTPGVLQETLPGRVHHEMFEGDLKEGAGTAELCAPDVTQAGASMGSRHRRAQEPGAEQGESPEEARRTLLLQGKGTGVEELMLKAAEHLQGAAGESMKAGELALMEVHGEGWMQEKTGWEKEQLPGEAEDAALSQGENLEAGLGPPEAGEAGLTVGWQLAMDELGPAVAPGECAEPLGRGLGEEADLPSGLSQKLGIQPGEHLEPEPPSQAEARMGAARGDSVLPEVTVAPGAGMLEEEHISSEEHPWEETPDAEAVRGDVAWGGSVGAAVPPAEEQEGGVGTSVQSLEAPSSHAKVQLLAEVEVALQPAGEAGSPGQEQGWSVAPGVQLLEEGDKPELGLGGGTGAAVMQGEGPSPAETPAGTPDLGGLFPVKAPALELVEAEDSWVDTRQYGGASPEPPQGEGDDAAVHLLEEAEDGDQGQEEQELPLELAQEPVPGVQGAGAGQGEGADAGVQPWQEALTLGVLGDLSSDGHVQLIEEIDELRLTPGGSRGADLTPLGAAGVWDGEQIQAPGSEAGLCAAHGADGWEGAAGAHGSSPAEASSHPECAAEGPGLEAMLGALTGPDRQIPEDTQTLEIPQGERADTEEMPLDGAQGVESVQGERLEAVARVLCETESPGIKPGRDDGASALPPPVSEVALKFSRLKLETMMQEDVLIPDVWRLGASGQAAQSELQEQVSAQADKVRLHAASQQSEEKPPHVMETEQVSTRPAEPPKQEVPPGPPLRMSVQQEEDAGNDPLGMVLEGSLLGDAAKSSMWPQRQLLGERSGDLNVGQWEKKQEVGQKMSQEGKASPGEPGAVTGDGAGAAPRGSPEACLDPDHLYNVLFVGDSDVGKTSFLYRLHADTFNPHLTATVGLDYQVKNLVVDNKHFALRLWDSAGQERYHSITKQFFRKADGVVLMYDITSEFSFSGVRYWLSCIQDGAEAGVAIVLLGNKIDCAAERKVPTKEGERLAEEHQLVFFECSAASGHNVSESMVSLIRLLKVREDELKKKAEEVPKPPQKKKGCCW